MANGSLMKVKSSVECSPWSILQYFWPALSDNWSWKPICGLFESGHVTLVLHRFYCIGVNNDINILMADIYWLAWTMEM